MSDDNGFALWRRYMTDRLRHAVEEASPPITTPEALRDFILQWWRDNFPAPVDGTVTAERCPADLGRVTVTMPRALALDLACSLADALREIPIVPERGDEPKAGGGERVPLWPARADVKAGLIDIHEAIILVLAVRPRGPLPGPVPESEIDRVHRLLDFWCRPLSAAVGIAKVMRMPEGYRVVASPAHVERLAAMIASHTSTLARPFAEGGAS